jgi:hypothetical protein
LVNRKITLVIIVTTNLTKAMNTETASIQFLAALEGVELTKEQHARISSGIAQVVMKELASLDNHGDLAMSRKIKLEKIRIPGPILDGIYARSHKDIFNI